MLYAWDASKQTMFCKLGVVLCTRQQLSGVCMATWSPVLMRIRILILRLVPFVAAKYYFQ